MLRPRDEDSCRFFTVFSKLQVFYVDKLSTTMRRATGHPSPPCPWSTATFGRSASPCLRLHACPACPLVLLAHALLTILDLATSPPSYLLATLLCLALAVVVISDSYPLFLFRFSNCTSTVASNLPPHWWPRSRFTTAPVSSPTRPRFLLTSTTHVDYFVKDFMALFCIKAIFSKVLTEWQTLYAKATS